MKSRLEYLDMARGLAMLAIVLGHIYTTNFIRVWICSFHVALFFIITGCLIKYKDDERKISEIVKSRIKNILVPYILFGVVYIAIEYVLNDFDILLLQQNTRDMLMLKGVGALWYLPTFFIAEILFLTIKKLVKKDIFIVLISIIIFVFGYIVPQFYFNQFILMGIRILAGVMFISIGYYMFDFINNIDISVFLVIAILGLNIILSNINGMVDLYCIDFKNIFLYLINAILGSIGILYLCKEIKSNKILLWIGVNSLTIMCTHQNLIHIFRKINNNDLNTYILGLALLIAILIIEKPITYIVNNYLPFMLGRVRKKRTITD